MRLPRGYDIDYQHPGTITVDAAGKKFANVTLRVAWWRVVLMRIFGKRGAG